MSDQKENQNSTINPGETHRVKQLVVDVLKGKRPGLTGEWFTPEEGEVIRKGFDAIKKTIDEYYDVLRKTRIKKAPKPVDSEDELNKEFSQIMQVVSKR